jgi:CBS domain-containing protein
MSAICELTKAGRLFTVDEQQTVAEAARIMADQNIGAAPVLRDGELVGIFSERDIMKRVVAKALDPQLTKVGHVMSTDVLTVAPQESLENCMVLMKTHGVRHLPIVEEGKLVGVVSLRDVLLHEVDEMDGEVRAMRAYIQSCA